MLGIGQVFDYLFLRYIVDVADYVIRMAQTHPACRHPFHHCRFNLIPVSFPADWMRIFPLIFNAFVAAVLEAMEVAEGGGVCG
jgi:hypothetical protein